MPEGVARSAALGLVVSSLSHNNGSVRAGAAERSLGEACAGGAGSGVVVRVTGRRSGWIPGNKRRWRVQGGGLGIGPARKKAAREGEILFLLPRVFQKHKNEINSEKILR
jgi:hypothetical protein